MLVILFEYYTFEYAGLNVLAWFLHWKNYWSCLCCFCKECSHIQLMNTYSRTIYTMHAHRLYLYTFLTSGHTTINHVYICSPQVMKLSIFGKRTEQEAEKTRLSWLTVKNFEWLAKNVSIFPTELHLYLNIKSGNTFVQEKWSRVEKPCSWQKKLCCVGFRLHAYIPKPIIHPHTFD